MANPNARLFYACMNIGIAPQGSTTPVAVHGVQSAGMSTRFNYEQVYELGKLPTYQNIENIPDVEVTIERVLDGYAPAYLLATSGAAAASLIGRSDRTCNFTFAAYDDTVEETDGKTPIARCFCSGMYVNSVSYTMPVEGNFTESVTLVGNNKTWTNGFTQPGIDFADAPAALTGVARRQHFVVGTGSGSCTLPTLVQGVDSNGKVPLTASGTPSHIQNMTVSANLNRESLFELGRKSAYFKYIPFPIEITSTIEVLTKQGDLIEADEEADENTAPETIRIFLEEGLRIDCGDNNYLTSVDMGGGQAGQGTSNATVTYNFSNWDSNFVVRHPADPTVALRPS